LYATHPVEGESWVLRQRAHWMETFARHEASGNPTPLWYPAPTISFPPAPYSAADVL
jgi:hypothetical protein